MMAERIIWLIGITFWSLILLRGFQESLFQKYPI